MQPSTEVMVAHVDPTPGTATHCPSYAHMPPPGHCIAPLHLTLMVISVNHVESLLHGEKWRKMRFRTPPPASPLHDWMVKREPDSFIGVLCTSWVFYRDMNERNEDGNTPYRPLFFARVSSENQGKIIMRMTGEWFKAAKAHMASPSLGRSVHHVKGDRVQPTLNAQVHPKGPTPKDWKFEVLTKMAVIQKQQIASEEWLAYARAFLAPGLQQSTPQESNRDLAQETKGAHQKIGKIKNPPMKTPEPIKNESGSKQEHLWLIQSWCWTMIAYWCWTMIAYSKQEHLWLIRTPYRLIQNEPTPAPTKPTFSTKDQHDASTFIQITEDLVALHIGHKPKLTSATMLVDSGAPHILVRQEHIHVLKDIVMSAPNTKSFASLKSAKKGSELSPIGRGLLKIRPFCLQAFIFSDDELEDTLLGLDPLTEHGCTAIFTHESFHLYYKTNSEPILSGSKKSNQKAWKVQIQQQTKAPDIVPVPVASSAFAGKLHGRQTDSEYVQFVHASLGFPAPTTFMNAVRKRFITGPNQYTRLTPKLVTKNMPNSMATARGHLDRTRMGEPHADSQSVSALRRFHDSQIISAQNLSASTKHSEVAPCIWIIRANYRRHALQVSTISISNP
jgi:hypothetical protein